ncbi:polyprenyl synthetase family protein [Sulfitobacter sp. JB4-11]|uniref:polyprenyl synthetase family protein n=1 Tax=Sulfitobacter rhodophyticola TaxID=3238304 RepID=UPI003517E902
MNNEGGRTDWIIPELGFEAETEALRTAIGEWVNSTPEEMQPQLGEQFLAGSKYFRPLTIFACQTAVAEDKVTQDTLHAAVALELFHNMTLVIDDILDHSDERRGKPTMHTAFGQLTALMTSGFMVAEGYRMAAHDKHVVALLSELLTRLGVAEVLQWNSRKLPRGVEDWRRLAQEDTGSMFEVAACLGDRSEGLRQFGGLLGTLYHACDDVSDVRGTEALGGGGEEDIRDGILTLPAAIAVRDPDVAEMFRDPNPENYDALAEAFRAALPEAEDELDRIADSAIAEAKRFAKNPEKLIILVERTRALGSVR